MMKLNKIDASPWDDAPIQTQSRPLIHVFIFTLQSFHFALDTEQIRELTFGPREENRN